MFDTDVFVIGGGPAGLAVAICSDADLESTLRRGFSFLKSASPVALASVLGAMVVRSKFAPQVVDAAIDFARSASSQPQRGFVLHSITKACSYNMAAALDYIEYHSSQNHRGQAALAIGMTIAKVAGPAGRPNSGIAGPFLTTCL